MHRRREGSRMTSRFVFLVEQNIGRKAGLAQRDDQFSEMVVENVKCRRGKFGP